VTAVFVVLTIAMTPSSYTPSIFSATAYRITQPYVALRYFRSFFLPVHLIADSDLAPLTSAMSLEGVAGFAFRVAMLVAIWWCAHRVETRPVAFGLAWFLLARGPTSWFVLAEVENDHRMFFAFVGLSISVVWTAGLLWRWFAMRIPQAVAVAGALVVLAVSGYGAHQRNRVWRDEASLWRDVTIKSPHNGRGLMNYGLTRMGRGSYPEALDYFTRALQYTPNYSTLETTWGS